MTPRRPLGFAAATGLVLALGGTIAFLTIPVVALFTEVPLGSVPGLLGREEVRQALEVTARTSLVANLLILGFGTPAAYLLATRRFPGRGLLITLVELPLVLPPAVAGICLLSAFGAGGLFGDELRSAGVVLPFSEWAVVLAVTFVAAPFYLRQAIAAFAAVDPMLPGTARTLGAGPLRAFARITLPLAAAGLTAGWVLSFARGIGEFGATIIFAGSVRGQTQTLTLAIYGQLDSDLDVAIAIGILLVVIAAAVLVAYKLVAWQLSRSESTRLFAPSPSTSR
ncbi:MAG TPA: ABC transporter permease [Solirubrobacteraceae bacterium]|nr:ABC transporter permease [Solirubrobacteraceae bacterium]